MEVVHFRFEEVHPVFRIHQRHGSAIALPPNMNGLWREKQNILIAIKQRNNNQ
jgi:hypothetical protein